jgi:hypothetical protein
MDQLWWIVPGALTIALLTWAGHRALMSANGSGSGIADAMGNFIDVFEPARARAARDLQDHQNQGPVAPVPDDEDDAPVRLVRGPDGRPRAVRIRTEKLRPPQA